MVNKSILSIFIIAVLILASCSGMDENSNKKEVTGTFTENDYKNQSVPSVKLARELSRRAEPNDGGNVFVSPVSLFMALSMLQNGAEGETRKEIITAIQAEDMSPDELNQANASLLDHLQNLETDTVITIANSVWLNDEHTLQTEFKNLLHDYYLAVAEEIDISKSKSADLINKWASESTNGKIDKIVEPPLPDNLVMYLMNVVYFKAAWMYPFSTGATAGGVFHLKDGTETTVPFMNLQESVPYFENDEFQAVSLPYGEGEMAMDIYVPRESVELDTFMDSWTAVNHAAWIGEFEERQGTVMIPKFKIEYEVILNDLLSDLGMQRAFTDQAELGKLVAEDSPLLVSEVKQKTYLSVDENGTEAAAVTSVAVSETSAPAETFVLRADRPFFLTIRDTESDTILFAGKIINPVQ
ncbi:serpin family protein [Sporosarcina sp.]|uniref:serpin family protein n=1 Tax=Sporosarcina sp. TaxID=49982 RepID=UPI00263861F1|nr:serpin family protein [Sporosarcina sp.]